MQLAKTTPEQRAGIYEDVRSLIVPGFLAHPVTVGDARFVLRSIDRADWSLLEFRTKGLSEKEWRTWCVVSSIWMVNGSILDEDEDATYRLFESFVELPRAVIDTLYSVLNGLMRRVLAASEVVEAFLYESESRSLWRTQGTPLLERRRGHGPQRFYNPVFSLWIYYNQMEDQRESEEQAWIMTKFAVGPHAPKSIKKLNAQDKKREGDIKRRRESTQDRVYYEFIGLVAKKGEEEKASQRKFQEVIMAETEEELRESMRRWVAGEKDHHDGVVDNVKAKIKYEVESRREEARKRRAALDAALEEEGFTPSKPMLLAGEAGRQFLERMKARVPGAKTVVDDHTHNSAYQKYIEHNPEVGDLHVDDEGNIVALNPVTEEMLDVLRKPEKGSQESLQQQIESRKPTATFIEEDG